MKRHAGFTLLEMIMVVIVLVTLAGIAIPLAGSVIEDAKVARAMDFAAKIADACRRYYAETGKAPTDLGVLWEAPSGGLEGWNGPYIDRPVDASDNPFGGGIAYKTSLQIFLTSGPPATPSLALEMADIPDTSITKLDQGIDGNLNDQLGSFHCVRGTGPSTNKNLGIFFLMPTPK